MNDSNVIKINALEIYTDSSVLTGEEILNLVNKKWQEVGLEKKLKSGVREYISPFSSVNILDDNIDRFETANKQALQG